MDYKNNEQGFTLIELLIVIAVIGVLAATVLLSLGNQTENARTASVKASVSGIRTAALAEALGDSIPDDGICDGLFGKVSGEKDDWDWDATNHCDLVDTVIVGTGVIAGDAGDLCCASINTGANKGNWVVWSVLPTADGSDGTAATGNQARKSTPDTGGDTEREADIYCTDSSGFMGELDLADLDHLNLTTRLCK